MPRGLQLLTSCGGTAILPDDGTMEGLAATPIPDHHRLSLVGNTDRANGFSSRLHDLGKGFQDRLPYLHGVVFHPAWSWKVLGELPICKAERHALFVYGECANSGRA